ncbi:MAG: LptA/OstA family protein, partial [Hyphomicrobium sp.]
MSRASSPSLIAGLHVFAGMTALIFALFVTTPANAQALTNTFGGLSESSNEPIDIESDALVVHDKDRYATFKGNVKAVQGSTTLRASELNVHVGGDKPASGAKKQVARKPAATKSSDAKENSAGGDDDAQTGKMIGISEDPMDIESDVLVVHDKEKYATFRGNVKAVQGTSTLSAGELTVNYVGGDELGSASGVTKALSVEGQAGASNAQITKIEANGNVVITNKKDNG